MRAKEAPYIAIQGKIYNRDRYAHSNILTKLKRSKSTESISYKINYVY